MSIPLGLAGEAAWARNNDALHVCVTVRSCRHRAPRQARDLCDLSQHSSMQPRTAPHRTQSRARSIAQVQGHQISAL